MRTLERLYWMQVNWLRIASLILLIFRLEQQARVLLVFFQAFWIMTRHSWLTRVRSLAPTYNDSFPIQIQRNRGSILQAVISLNPWKRLCAFNFLQLLVQLATVLTRRDWVHFAWWRICIVIVIVVVIQGVLHQCELLVVVDMLIGNDSSECFFLMNGYTF